ncbi:hypothetical protein [Alloyangia mangrovi]|nr:hypothetical protein [Alloyangia mangrovi]
MFLERPISAVLLAIAVLLLVFTVIMPMIRRHRESRAETRDA